MYHADCNLRPENIHVSEISTNRILKEIAVLECENAKLSKLTRIFIDFLNVSVSSDTVIYTPIP